MSWKDKISKAVSVAGKNAVKDMTGNAPSGISKAFKSYAKNPQASYYSKRTSSGGGVPKTSYVNENVPEGGIGIRKALNEYGINNDSIGYRENGGNGIVTVNGRDFMNADAVKDGVSYGTPGAIRKAFGAYQASNGDPVVKVSDYVTGKGLGANLSYNDGTGMVSVGGSEFKPSYIDNGISYAPKSVVDKALADYQTNTGMQSYADLIKKNNEEYGKYTKKLVDALTDREKFSYNPESDPAYIAYKDMYEREGKRAALEAVAAYAGLNGGLGTSAAVTAAAQAQNDWLDKLNDRIPELYDVAYQRYANDRNFDVDALAKIEGIKQQALSNEMQAQSAMYDAAANENERNRQRYLDDLTRKQTEEDREYTRRANDISLAEGNLNLDNARVQSILNNASIRGYFTEDEAKALGVDVNTTPMEAAARLDLYTYDRQKGIDADYDVETYGRKLGLEAQFAPAAGSSSGGRSSGGSSRTSSYGSKKSGSNAGSYSEDFSTDMKTFIKTVNNNAIKKGLNAVLNSDGSSKGVGEDFLANQLAIDETLSDAEKEIFIKLWGISPEALDTVTNSRRYR